LYVADEALHRITVFGRDGQFLDKWGVPGSKAGELDRPAYLAFDADDNLYVADSFNHRIQKFSKDGRFLGQWGAAGHGPGQFNLPWGVAADNVGDLYVADWRNDRIQKFGPEGDFLAQWGTSGSEAGQFRRPSSVAVDADGLLYIADWGNERVQVLTQGGEVLAVLRGDSSDSVWAEDYFAANPDEAGQRKRADLEPGGKHHRRPSREESASTEKLLWGPTAVKLDVQGRVYIVDSCRHRLQIYRKSTDP
jgi:DNA-binding beta-propeller fold protein YncE